MDTNKSHMVTEFVPGTQVTLCHMIARPDVHLARVIGLKNVAIGIMSITPGEAAVIAADIITKSSPVEIVFVDRYLGTLLITGQPGALEAALAETMSFLSETMGFESVSITRS